MSRVRAAPARNITTPASRRSGDARDTSNERTCTINVVPTLAPSIAASAGTSATKPALANDAIISPVAVLLCRIVVTPRPAAAALIAVVERLGEKAPEVGPEGALHPALHHVNAPQEERNGSTEIEEAQSGVHGSSFEPVEESFNNPRRAVSFKFGPNLRRQSHQCAI